MGTFCCNVYRDSFIIMFHQYIYWVFNCFSISSYYFVVLLSSLFDTFPSFWLQFSGDAGIKFQETCADCCRNQSHALEVLKKQQRKDQKFANFLQVSGHFGWDVHYKIVLWSLSIMIAEYYDHWVLWWLSIMITEYYDHWVLWWMSIMINEYNDSWVLW